MDLNRWVLGVCGLLALAGCGDDGDGNGGGAVSTGLESSQVLGDVTAEQAQDLCATLRDSAQNAISDQELQRFTCTFAGLTTSIQLDAMGNATVDRAACEASVDMCLEQPGEVTETDNCTSANLMAALAGCTATAGELEGCLNASISGIRAAFSQITCSADVSTTSQMSGFEEPAQCEALDMKCPGVLDAVGDATETLPDVDVGGGSGAGGASGFGGSGTGGVGGGGGAGGSEGPGGCSDTCDMVDEFCDDGGEGSATDWCPFGTDCTDCGARP